MILEKQILSLIFSFIYGIIIMYIFSFFKVIKKGKYKTVSIFFFCINITLIYFLLNKIINNGDIHIYFVLNFVLGILFYKKFIK